MAVSFPDSLARTVSGYTGTGIAYLNPVFSVFSQYSHLFQNAFDYAPGTDNCQFGCLDTTGIDIGDRLRISGGPYDGVSVGVVTAVGVNLYFQVSGINFKGDATGIILNLSDRVSAHIETRIYDPATTIVYSKAPSAWSTNPNLSGIVDLQSELRSLFYQYRESWEGAGGVAPFLQASANTKRFIPQFREVWWDGITGDRVEGTWADYDVALVATQARKQIQETYGGNLIDYEVKSIDGFTQFLNPSFNLGLKYWKQTNIDDDDAPWVEIPSGIMAKTGFAQGEQLPENKFQSGGLIGYHQVTSWAGGVNGWSPTPGVASCSIPVLGDYSTALINDFFLEQGKTYHFVVRTRASGGGVYALHWSLYDENDVVMDNGQQQNWNADGVWRLALFTLIPASNWRLAIFTGGATLAAPLNVECNLFSFIKRSYALNQIPFGYLNNGPIQPGDTITISTPYRASESELIFQAFVTSTSAYPSGAVAQFDTRIAMQPITSPFTLGGPGNAYLQIVVWSDVDFPIYFMQKNGKPPGRFLTRFSEGRQWGSVPSWVAVLIGTTAPTSLRIIQYAWKGGFATNVLDQNYGLLPAGVYRRQVVHVPDADYYTMIAIQNTGENLTTEYVIQKRSICAPAVMIEWQNSLGGTEQWVFQRRQSLALTSASNPSVNEWYDYDIENSPGNLSRDWSDTQVEMTLADDFVETKDVYWLDEIKKSRAVTMIFANGGRADVIPIQQTTVAQTRTKYSTFTLTVRLPKNFNPALIDAELQ